jgi:sporulation protein YlmC with PRC-barrel domain
MLIMRTRIVLAVAVLAASMAPAWPGIARQPPGTGSTVIELEGNEPVIMETREPGGLIQAESIVGRELFMPGGDKVGEIVDFYVDPVTGFIDLAVVRHGGLLEEDKHALVPRRSMAYDWGAGSYRMLDEGFDIAGAPTVEPPFQPDFPMAKVGEVHLEYGQQSPIGVLREQVTAYLSAEHPEAVRQEEPGGLVPLTRLVDLPVRNDKGLILGTLDRIYADPDAGALVIALIRMNDPDIREADMVPLPWPALAYMAKESAYATGITIAEIKKAKTVTLDEPLGSMASAGNIYYQYAYKDYRREFYEMMPSEMGRERGD